MNTRKMNTFNASSVAKSQQWHSDLLMQISSDPVPISTQEIFKEPVLQKYQALQRQRSQMGQHGQHSQHGQHGHHGVHVQHGQHGRHGQHSQHGHQGQHGQQGPQGQQGQLVAAGQPGQTAMPTPLGHQVLTSATVCCDQANCDRAKIEQYLREPATPFTLMNPPDGCDPQPAKKDPAEQYLYCPCGMTRGQLITICCTGRDCDNSTKIDEMPMGPPEEKIAKTAFNQNHHKY